MAVVQSESHGKVTLISECFVKPKYEVESAKQPYYLGAMDLTLIAFDQMQKGLLFINPPNNNNKPTLVVDLVENLKHSLSLSLVHFYPLAGRFATQKFHDEDACLIYVDCNKGPGARLLHATVDLSVSDIVSSTDVHPIVRSFFDLGEKSVNHDGHTRPLLSIQVTKLRDGVFIGFTMNHSVADGTSLWHFISSLSEIFLQLYGKPDNNNNNNNRTDDESVTISRKPVFETLLPDGYSPILKFPYLEPEEFLGRRSEPGPFRERIFRFSTTSVSKIKAIANQECGGGLTITSFRALTALLWRSITRARNLQPDELTSCSLAVSIRTKIVQQISEERLGNFVSIAQGNCKASDILGHDLGWVATFVHQFIVAKQEKLKVDFLDRFVKKPFVNQTRWNSGRCKTNSLNIGGSARYDMYGPEFGFGKAVAVLAGYAAKDDGKVTANPGREGGGSIDLEVCLKPETMNALELDEEFMSFVLSV